MEVQLTGLRGHHKENPPGTTHQLHTLFQAALTFSRRKRIRGEEREGGRERSLCYRGIACTSAELGAGQLVSPRRRAQVQKQNCLLHVTSSDPQTPPEMPAGIFGSEFGTTGSVSHPNCKHIL